MKGWIAGIAGTALLVGLSLAGSAAAGDLTGVEGLAAYRGDFIKGAVVLAFPGAGPGPGELPLAVSEPTDDDGRYRLLLPPGTYYLLAVRSETDPWPPSFRPGDLYCYYLGNPIPVRAGRMTRVGFNMIEIPAEGDPERGVGSGVAGRILFEGKPLGRAYLYVYRDGSTNFRGMGVAALPTDEEGRFRLKLAPGRYYLLARKRRAGGMFGPPQKEDYIGYYFANPVDVEAREFRHVTLETTTRIDLLEEIWFRESKSAGWFSGTVVDDSGRPVGGLYDYFYPGPETEGTPAFLAGPTDEEGRFRVRAAPGRYRLLARSGIGGPPAPGDWRGVYRGPGGEESVEASGEREVRIVVTRPPAP